MIKEWISNHRFLVYCFLAYLLSWSIAVPLALFPQRIPSWLHYLTAYGPMLSAIIVTLSIGGCEGLKRLFGKAVEWKIGLQWFLFAISPLIVFMLVNLFQHGRLLDATLLGQVNFLPNLGIGALLLWIATSGVGEEIGWRGFALPVLQKRHNALKSSLILGVIWAGWHIPAFFYVPTYMKLGFAILPMFVLGILTGAIVYTWLYNSTHGNVLTVILFHGVFNFVTASKAGEGLPAAVVSTLIMMWAVVLVIIYKPVSLSQHPKVGWECTP